MIKKRHFQLLAFSLMMTVASMYGPEAAANAALIEQATSAAEQGDIEGAVIANEQLSLLYGEEPEKRWKRRVPSTRMVRKP